MSYFKLFLFGLLACLVTGNGQIADKVSRASDFATKSLSGVQSGNVKLSPKWLTINQNAGSALQSNPAAASPQIPLEIPRNPADFPTFRQPAQPCDRTLCKLPDCRCGGTDIPGSLPVEQTPQMIILTFDDDVNDVNYELYRSIFDVGRHNPNNCSIRGTFFVSHEWNEYSLTQNLYGDGHEIASHSISHTMPNFDNSSKEWWGDEISGQRQILNHFANVHFYDIKGMRAPFLQPGGNEQFEMLWEKGFLYDSSLSVGVSDPPIWPYTFDYALEHRCVITPCPTNSYPGLWEVPLADWNDLQGYPCAMADACQDPGDADGVFNLIMRNFKRHYQTNRAPFDMFYHSSWFVYSHHRKGFKKFLDTVLSMPDVWFVTASQAIQWIQNPTPLSALNQFVPWQCANQHRPRHCKTPNVCQLLFRGEVRYMQTCRPCPDRYPWIKNTHGTSRSRLAPSSGNLV